MIRIPRPFSNNSLELIYPMPKPMRTIEEWRRLHGHDLEHLDDLALQRERRCVLRRMDYEPANFRRTWLAQRLTAIDRERGYRRAKMTATGSPQRTVNNSDALASSGLSAFEYRQGQVVER